MSIVKPLRQHTKWTFQQKLPIGKYETDKQLPADRVLTDSTLDNLLSLRVSTLGLNKLR